MEQKHYSLMALATLASASLAQGQIQYTDLDPDQSFLVDNSYTNLVDVDLDGDGSADLQFRSNYLSYGFELEAKAVNPDWKFAGDLFYSFFNSCSAYYVRGASVAFGIGAAASFRSDAAIFLNTFPCGDITDWNQGEVKYMGLQKQDGSDFYYGWLRIERRPNVGFDELFILRDHALNLTPGATIVAGDAGGVCLSPGNLTAVVSGSSATLSWEEIYNADGYQLEGRLVGSTAAKSKITGSNSLTIPSLNPGSYAWKVRTGCLPDLSDFSEEAILNIPALKIDPGSPDVSLKLYPNPAADFALLDLSAVASSELVQLFDMLGQLVWQSEALAQDNHIEIPVSGLQTGTYLLSVTAAQGVQSTRLIVE